MPRGEDAQVGVRDLVARGHFILAGASQREGELGSDVPCRMLSDQDPGQSPVMPDRDGV